MDRRRFLHGAGAAGTALLLVLAGCTASYGNGPAQTNPTVDPGHDRLEINSSYDGNFSLTLIEQSTDEVVLSRSYPPEATTTLADAFEAGVTYRAVISVGDEVRWNRSVYDYEVYWLTIHENGSVQVELHGEV